MGVNHVDTGVAGGQVNGGHIMLSRESLGVNGGSNHVDRVNGGSNHVDTGVARGQRGSTHVDTGVAGGQVRESSGPSTRCTMN